MDAYLHIGSDLLSNVLLNIKVFIDVEDRDFCSPCRPVCARAVLNSQAQVGISLEYFQYIANQHHLLQTILSLKTETECQYINSSGSAIVTECKCGMLIPSFTTK